MERSHHRRCGARLKKIASAARNAGLGGFEWMEGIPGNLGGAIRMNAGAMGTETFDQIVSVRFIDTDGTCQREAAGTEIVHHYRSVPEFEERYVVSAVLKGSPAPQAEIDAKARRLSPQSAALRSPSVPVAGCVFKNPEVCGAGKLIDDLGLKGRSVEQSHRQRCAWQFHREPRRCHRPRSAGSGRPDQRNRDA
jgi:UDP-N-acetylmuramate--alanine ligase